MDPASGSRQRIVRFEQLQQIVERQPVRPGAASGRHQVVVVGADLGAAGEGQDALFVHGQGRQQILDPVDAQSAEVHDVVDERPAGARKLKLDVERRVGGQERQHLRRRVVEPDVLELGGQRRSQGPQQGLVQEFGVHPLDEISRRR